MVQISKIWLRVFVVFLIHIIIKSFDLSFPNGPFELSLRSLWFSVWFNFYGIILWTLAAWFDKNLKQKLRFWEGNRKKTLTLFTSHAFFSYPLMLSVNHIYRLSDIYLFNSSHFWESIPFFNPELTISLTCLYLLIYGFDSYSRMHNQLKEKLLKEEQ